MNIIRALFGNSAPKNFEVVLEPKNQGAEKKTANKKSKPQPELKKHMQEELPEEKVQSPYFSDTIQEEIQKIRIANEEKCMENRISPDAFRTGLHRFCFLPAYLRFASQPEIFFHSEVYKYLQDNMSVPPLPHNIKFGYSQLFSFIQKNDDDLGWYFEDENGYYGFNLHDSSFRYLEKRYWRIEPVPDYYLINRFMGKVGWYKRCIHMFALFSCPGNNRLVPVSIYYKIYRYGETNKKPGIVVEELTGNESYADILNKIEIWKQGLTISLNLQIQ